MAQLQAENAGLKAAVEAATDGTVREAADVVALQAQAESAVLKQQLAAAQAKASAEAQAAREARVREVATARDVGAGREAML